MSVGRAMVVEFVNLVKANCGHLDALIFFTQKYMEQKVLLAARDMEQARELDQELWTFAPEAFLPHSLAPQPGQEREKVLINTGFNNLNQARTLILAYNPPAAWLPPKTFQHVVELLPVEEGPQLDACRERWRALNKRADVRHITQALCA